MKQQQQNNLLPHKLTYSSIDILFIRIIMYTTFLTCLVLFICSCSIENVKAQEKLWNSVWQGQSIDCTKTHWMHTAKTASTFCLAIQHVCCPTEFEHLTEGIHTESLTYAYGSPRNRTLAPFRYDSQYCFKFIRDGYPKLECKFAGRPEHIPLYPQDDLQKLMGMVVIREPKGRVISALLDGVHIEGFENRTHLWELKRIFTEIDHDNSLSKEVKLMTKAEMYVYSRDLYGHQVKMLLGLPHLDLSVYNETLLHEVVNKAVDKLRQFFFVGVFEEYARSLHLFHALANVDTVPTHVELFPMRSTSSTDKAFLMTHLAYDDPYDSLLHQRARQIFQEEIDFVKQWKGIEL